MIDIAIISNSKQRGPNQICDKVHFRAVMQPHTDPTLGNCSYLDACRYTHTHTHTHTYTHIDRSFIDRSLNNTVTCTHASMFTMKLSKVLCLVLFCSTFPPRERLNTESIIEQILKSISHRHVHLKHTVSR